MNTPSKQLFAVVIALCAIVLLAGSTTAANALAPAVCPGAWENDTQATATPLAIYASAYDSFTVALGDDDVDWYRLTNAVPGYTYRVVVSMPASESPVWFAVINGGNTYPYYCQPGFICKVIFSPAPGPVYVQLDGNANGDGNYAPPTPFCAKYSIRYSAV